jgi:hypothetical protein
LEVLKKAKKIFLKKLFFEISPIILEVRGYGVFVVTY